MRNEYIFDGEIVRIRLTQGHWALVDNDPAVLEKLYQYRWCAVKDKRYLKNKFYAHTGTNSVQMRMHKLITSCPGGYVVDHKNSDSLDNRLANLRVTSQLANGMNKFVKPNKSTGLRGVYPNSKYPFASIGVGNKSIYLGQFKAKHHAAIAYDCAKVITFTALDLEMNAETSLNYPEQYKYYLQHGYDHLQRLLKPDTLLSLSSAIDDLRLKHEQTHCFLYLASNENGLTKIGYSKDLARRNKVLKFGVCKGSDKSTEIFFYVELQNEETARTVEACLHKKFKHLRLTKTEYFNLTPLQIEEAKLYLATLAN